MHLIAYISHSCIPANEVTAEIKNITATAKRKNQEHNITGALFFHKDRFVQVIEGEEKSLKKLMENIERDSRHENIVILIDTSVKERGFSDWSMESFNLSQSQDLDPDALLKISNAFKANLIPRSDLFIDILRELLPKNQ